MRIHGSPKDQDWWPNHLSECPTVMLDGVKVEHVVEADDQAGHVILEIWENGRPRINFDLGCIEIETKHGHVEIIGTRLAP